MIVLPIITPGKEDTFLSKIGPSSANESEITYKVTQQLIKVYYVTADKNSCIFCHYLRATLQRKSFFSLNHHWHNPKSMQLKKNAPMKGPEQILDNLRYTENVWPDRIATLSGICFNAFDFQSSRFCYHATSLVKWKKKSKSHYKCYES